MVVRKVKGGHATVHCSGRQKGKVIKKFKTRAEANAQHRAIQASKRTRVRKVK
jgi:hypothetical protein